MASNSDNNNQVSRPIKREIRDLEALNPENMREFSISRILGTLELMNRSLERMAKRVKALEEERKIAIAASPLPMMFTSGISITTPGSGSLSSPHENFTQPDFLVSSTPEQQRGVQLAVDRLDRWSGDLQEISWSQYKESFQRVCSTLSEQTRLIVLNHVLDSPAKSIFSYLLQYDQLTWQQLNTAFTREFDGERRREAQQMIIFSEIWDSNYERLHQFAKRISNLVDQAFPPQQRDFIKIQQVIRAAQSYPIFQGRNEWIRNLSWSAFLDVITEGEEIYRSRQRSMPINSIKSECS
ncbi:unnamed protein product [Dimorphilus gyrociliatus]|uniref:Uncharacterized protein n=1 Tax=Dimorphilus gyrociliatus TaxID=2664684 RepID=A0A7I8WBF0_9ANNE|nr:unnamed protein product [Dimorphilus gyrociliatus]